MSFGLGDVMVSITGGDYKRCGLEAWWSGILGPTSIPGPEELGELTTSHCVFMGPSYPIGRQLIPITVELLVSLET